MKFYKDLYISPNLSKKRTRIKWALRYQKEKPDVYVITPAGADDLLEIYHSRQLKQSYYKSNPPYIVGIAESYEEAVALVGQILLDCQKETKSYDVKSFL